MFTSTYVKDGASIYPLKILSSCLVLSKITKIEENEVVCSMEDSCPSFMKHTFSTISKGINRIPFSYGNMVKTILF